MKNRRVSKRVTFKDPKGLPSVIVAVAGGEPFTLIVSDEVYNAFNATRNFLGISHIQLANKLKRMLCQNGGQFHEIHEHSIMAALRRC